MIYIGAIATKAILENKNKKIEYIMIQLNKKDRNSSYIINLAKEKNVEVKYVERSIIDEITNSKTHGGIITSATNNNTNTIYSINHKNNNVIFLIDGIEDPYNLGYAFRSLYAFGINTCILPNNHLISSDNIIVRSSAGASEKIQQIISDDVVSDLKYLKDKGYQILLLKRSTTSIPYFDYEYKGKIVICIGGEKRGLSKDIENQSNINIDIPYTNNFKNALNATSAITTIASEIQRQKVKGLH